MRVVTAAPTRATTLPTKPHSSPTTTVADPYSGSLTAPSASSTPLAGRAYLAYVRPVSPRSAEKSTLPGRPPASSSPLKDTLTQKHRIARSLLQHPPNLSQTCLTPRDTICLTNSPNGAYARQRTTLLSNSQPHLHPITATPNMDPAVAAEDQPT
jgi:hypothetical protein